MSSLLRSITRFLFCLLAGLAIAVAALAWMGVSPMPMVDQTLNQIPVRAVSWTGLRSNVAAVDGPWPPVVGQPYPDLTLTDQTGQSVRLSDLAGKVILLELAAVPCKGCQAFAGGNQRGGFGGVSVQPNLESIHEYAKRYGGVTLGSDDAVVFVQLLLYGKSMSSPTQDEVAGWARHFEMDRDEGEIVLRGDASMLGRQTYDMIPGFHLIDSDFVLRYDSSGHRPACDLYQDLLPALGRLTRQR